jgi:uncharacterized protein
MESRRLRRLPRAVVLGHEVPVARGLWTRLLGLALLHPDCASPGLLIPRCASVHTFGMRFALDVVFLDRSGRALREVRGVPPWRVVALRGADAVLETPTGVYAGAVRVVRSRAPKGEGMSLIDKLTGRTKKAAGDLADDPSLRREGRREEKKGEAKEKLDRAEEAVEDKASEVADLERKT